MVGNRAAVLGVDDGPRARSGERGDNLSDGLGMMAFGREFKSAFPGGGVKPATLGDAAAAEEGEERARTRR